MKPIHPVTQQENATFFRRSLIAGSLALLALLGLFIRYGYLEIVEYDQYRTQSDNNRIKLISIPPSRGFIYDRNGILLADNRPVFTAMMSPEQVKDPAYTLKLLAPILALSEEDIKTVLTRIKDNKNEPVTIKFDLTEAQVAKLRERKAFFEGVTVSSKLTRTYPYGELFAHAIGYVGRINDKEAKKIDSQRYAGTDLIGKLGIELSYEDVLLGEPGYQSVETNAYGDIIRQLNSTAPIKGNDIYLTLDYGLQTIAHQQLEGRRGAVVAINPKTGGVIAFASNPSFDPNLFISGISYKDYDRLRNDPDLPLYNRALQGMYPPGSTIKPFAGLGGIHYDLIDWNDTIYDPGYFTLPGDSHRFRDWKRGGHGTVNLKKSIRMSVDTFYYKLAYRMGIQRYHDWMVKFGFGSDTGIDLPNEKGGIMPSPSWKQERYGKKWLPGETISTSIGQGYFLATPLQIASATAIMANKGAHITPHLLMQSEGAKPVPVIDRPDGKIAFSGDVHDWDAMHDAMISVVEEGTAKILKRQGLKKYKIAGKTGTAQVKSIAQGKRYDESKLDQRHWDHALFMGFAPAEAPQLAVSVIVENGRHGSSTAGPIAKALFDYWLLQRPLNPITPSKIRPIDNPLSDSDEKTDETPLPVVAADLDNPMQP